MLLLGNSPDKIESSINTFHANELARTLLHAVHKRVAKNPDNNMIEGTSEGGGGRKQGHNKFCEDEYREAAKETAKKRSVQREMF
jgi:hypothetical protein